MYSVEKVTGLRELFNAVTENNQDVEVYGLRGSIDNEIYVRIRGMGDGGRLIWGAGPKKTLSGIFAGGKEKNGEMSKSFKAVWQLVKETNEEAKMDEFLKKCKTNSIHVENKFVEMNDYQLICEWYDPQYVAYKGGRKLIASSRDVSSSTSKKDIKVEVNLDQKVKEERKETTAERDKRGIAKQNMTSDSKRG